MISAGNSVSKRLVVCQSLSPVRVTKRALSAPVRVVSLDTSEDPDGEAPVDRLEQRSEHDPLSVTMRRQDMKRVEALLRELPERDRAILKWRFGLSGEDPMSSQRVGDRVGLSRERIRQIEQRCLGWLRRRLGLSREG